jgi:hypothetical protein
MLLDGSYAQEISRRKHLKPQNVLYQIRTLERAGIVKRVGGKTYPQFYERGPDAAIFEQAAARLSGDNKSDGRGVPTSKKNRSRTHAKGCVISLVLRAGEMHNLSTDEGNISLFPEAPYNSHNGNTFYRCKVPLDGLEVSLQFQRTEKGTMLFYVWPPEIMQTAGELSHYPKDYQERADRVLGLLSKYGDWRFGPSRKFAGETHFSVSEDAWFDRSKGTLESETTSLKKAWLWLNIDQLEDELTTRIDALQRYAEEVEEESATKVGNIYRSLNELTKMNTPPKKGGDDYDHMVYR